MGELECHQFKVHVAEYRESLKTQCIMYTNAMAHTT